MTIVSIGLKNFYSFKDKVKMSFLVNENAPKTSHFGLCNENNRFAKVSSIFGANGSGKTNLICGFRFLKWFIAQSFSHSDEGFSRCVPFETTKKEPSYFEVEFYIEKVFYKLSLKIDDKKTLSEVLESRKNARLVTLYSRQYIASSNTYKFEAKNIKLEKNFIEKVRPNASVISTARQYNHPELTKLREHWLSVFINISSETTNFFRDGFLFWENDISKFYSEHKDHFQQTKEFLKNADLGLSDIKIETKEREGPRGNKQVLFLPYGIHKSQGKTFKLPWPFESGGSQHLYNLLSFIFPTLKKGSVFVIDEIERNLHPNILPTLVNLFTSKESNPKDAQLLCATHAPTLMSILSKYQMFLVQKNSNCESETYRLDEFSEIRSDENILKKYLAGAYGGVPDIDM